MTVILLHGSGIIGEQSQNVAIVSFGFDMPEEGHEAKL